MAVATASSAARRHEHQDDCLDVGKYDEETERLISLGHFVADCSDEYHHLKQSSNDPKKSVAESKVSQHGAIPPDCVRPSVAISAA
jgi:hypothetical protein